MTLYYLDLETTGLDPATDRILTIQTQRLDKHGATGPLLIHRSWEKGEGEAGERAILEEFIQDSLFFEDAWTFVPVGFNLKFEFAFLLGRCLRHGLIRLPAGRAEAPLELLRILAGKPHVDLQPVAYLMNDMEFKGASLQNFSPKPASGGKVIDLLATSDWAGIERYIVEETDAFLALWRELSGRMPKMWREEIAPLFGREASPRGPPTPGL